MPGVLIIEAHGKTAGVMAGVTLGMADEGMLVYFMAIDSAKFAQGGAG